MLIQVHRYTGSYILLHIPMTHLRDRETLTAVTYTYDTLRFLYHNCNNVIITCTKNHAYESKTNDYYFKVRQSQECLRMWMDRYNKFIQCTLTLKACEVLFVCARMSNYFNCNS